MKQKSPLFYIFQEEGTFLESISVLSSREVEGSLLPPAQRITEHHIRVYLVRRSECYLCVVYRR